eukprot:gene16329-22518_t
MAAAAAVAARLGPLASVLTQLWSLSSVTIDSPCLPSAYSLPYPLPSHSPTAQVLTQLWSLSSLIIDSLAIAGQTLVAVEIGQKNRKGARELTDRLLGLGLALGLTVSLVLYALSPIWPKLFSSDAEVITIVSDLLPLATFMIPVNAVVYVLDAVVVCPRDNAMNPVDARGL